MPVITFANAKGGAGKTTAALLLATELAERGATVTILDADPQKWISEWASLPGRNSRISVIDQITPTSIAHHVANERRHQDFIVIDLAGTDDPLVANALCLSDLVLIPIQGCSMDARGGAKILELLATLQTIERRPIPHSVVLTRVGAAVTTRAMKAVQDHLKANDISVLKSAIVERAAFRDIFDYGGSLATMNSDKVSNLDKARENAQAFAVEVLRILSTHIKKQVAKPLVRTWRSAA